MVAISYIIPAYNCEATIDASVKSILQGNLSNSDEIVIVDDASTDGTHDIISALTTAFPRVRIVRHDRNLGGGAARNTAVQATVNDLIFCLDSDNLLLPGSVPRLAAFLREHKADAAAFGGQKFFNSDPRIISHEWSYKSGEIIFADLLCGHINPASSGNYIFSRRSWLAAEKYPEWAGALDTWGFGLRQIGSGAKMLTMRGTYYLHRWGHESYWIRWARKQTAERSKVAVRLLSPFMSRLTETSKEWMTSETNWFELLREHPLLLESGDQGTDGENYRSVRQRLTGVLARCELYARRALS
jgi:glycosyltransferase involved in cell wall biosynthesis